MTFKQFKPSMAVEFEDIRAAAKMPRPAVARHRAAALLGVGTEHGLALDVARTGPADPCSCQTIDDTNPNELQV